MCLTRITSYNVCYTKLLRPIVGPVIAVVYGWVPALLWVLLGGVLAHSKTFLRAQRYVAGGLYITLGVTTALSGSHSTTSAGS